MAGIIEYVVYYTKYSDTGSFPEGLWDVTVRPGVRTYKLVKLKPGKCYSIYVIARNENGYGHMAKTSGIAHEKKWKKRCVA